MATLKAVVRTPRADGFYPVYIRVTHRRASLEKPLNFDPFGQIGFVPFGLNVIDPLKSW